jgi:hypothetical protein
MIREEELMEIEDAFEYSVKGQAHWHLDDKQILKLIAEVRRLKSELESWQAIAHDRLKNWCMFAEKSGELEKENQHLKEEAKAIEGLKGYEDYLVVQRGLWDSQQENRRYKQTLEIAKEQIEQGYLLEELYHTISKALKGEEE